MGTGFWVFSSLVNVVVVVAILSLPLSYIVTSCPLVCSILIGWPGGKL